MDVEDVSAGEFAKCLGDLEMVNLVTLGHWPTLRFLARATKGLSGFSVLDVGFGNGDLLRAIFKWATKRGLSVDLSGVDLNPSSELAARAATPAEMNIDFRTGDVFAFVPDKKPDFIVTSLMTHHLTDPQLVALLRWMEATSVRGWFNHDLHRHIVAYYGFRALAALTRWHRMVRHDGAVSITRSFRRADWDRLLAEAGVDAEVRWVLPFKLCVSHLK